jgi:hypothetical protein
MHLSFAPMWTTWAACARMACMDRQSTSRPSWRWTWWTCPPSGRGSSSVAVDAVNSVGGNSGAQALLKALGVAEAVELVNCDARRASSPHNPEPLPAHLTDLSDSGGEAGQSRRRHLAVDPDVDRLAMVCEDGSLLRRGIHAGGLRGPRAGPAAPATR